MPAPLGPYSHIAKAGQFITISAIAGMDPSSGRLVGSDAYTQAKQILELFGVMLASVNSDLDHVVHLNIFLRNMADYDDVNRAYCEAMGLHRPAGTVVAVAELPKAGALLTMSLTAIARI